MCLIALKTAGAHLSEAEIRYDFLHNPDGAGFMYVKDGYVHWEKGFFTVNDLIKRWNEVVDDSMLAALHTRIATHGAHTTALCHPFPLDVEDLYSASGKSKLVLMHNGIIPENAWAKYYVNGDSDTSAYCRRLVSILNGDLPDNGIKNMMETHGGGSRFLIMNGDGEYVTVGNWYTSNGIKFSNRGFLGYPDFAHYYNTLPRYPYNKDDNKVLDEDDEKVFLNEEEIFEEADAEGLLNVSPSDLEGELHGAYNELESYFINPEDANFYPQDHLPVYCYDNFSGSFEECKNVWYEYEDETENVLDMLEAN